MKDIALILGYGIPKDIFQDENYSRYLGLVFNSLFDQTQKGKIRNPILIFCGGKTDMYEPFKRDEAGEMIAVFKSWMKKPGVKELTSSWQLMREKKSISTLENMTESKKLLDKEVIRHGNIQIFCEFTRKKKLQKISSEVFKRFDVKVTPVDFDISSNRYLDPEIIKKKERLDIRLSLAALQDEEMMKEHHTMTVKKLAYFREHMAAEKPEKIAEWWKEQVKEFSKKYL